jgi:large subunit ribosomal protein L10
LQVVCKLPTEAKRQIITELAEQIRRCTMAIATDISGLRVAEVTELRRRLRGHSLEYRVVKNRLASLAASEAGKETFGHILEGSTGIVFGYEEPVDAAKALDEFVRETRSGLVIRSGFMDGELLSRGQVLVLASLPPKRELQAMLLGQLQAPVAGLVRVLNGPVQGLTMVLQRRAEQLGGSDEPGADAPEV